jgi:hypothetical protein
MAGASLLATLVFMAPSAASAAECPNEAIRQQQGSTYLPDCMAYEMVSPPRKNNTQTVLPSISANEGRVLFFSVAALGDAPQLPSPVGEGYVASREGEGWTPTATAAPAGYGGYGEGGTLTPQGVGPLTPNFNRWITLAPTEVDGSQGRLLYFEGGLGFPSFERSPLLIPQDRQHGKSNMQNSQIQGVSPDLSHLYFQAGDLSTTFFPDDPSPDGTRPQANTYVNAYDRGGGGATVALLARDSSGHVWGGSCGAWLGSGIVRRNPDNPGFGGVNQGAISTDGSRVYFSTRPAQPEAAVCDPANPIRILERVDTAGGPQISEVSPSTPVEGSDFFEAASVDGSKVYFTTTRPLASTDKDAVASGAECSPTTAVQGCDLYLRERLPSGGHEIVQVSAGETTPAVEATADTEAGSKQLKNVATTTGTGTLHGATGTGALSGATGTGVVSAGSAGGLFTLNATTVTVLGEVGAFEVGQTVISSMVAPGTTIAAVGSGTIELSAPATGGGIDFSLAAAKKSLSGVTTSTGAFEAGQTISATGIPAGTTIASVGAGTLELSAFPTAVGSGTQTLAAGSKQVTGVTTSTGAFEAGQTISATGIPDGTTIASVGAGTLELSALPTESGTRPLAAGTKQVTAVTTSTGAFEVGQGISGAGIAPGTTIVAVGNGTLELSQPSADGGSKALSAGALPIEIDQEIAGPGIPPGATVIAVNGQTVEISQPATATASEVSIVANRPPGLDARVFEGATAISGDGSHVYFVAEGALTGADTVSGRSPEVAGPTAGRPNLYLYERDGTFPSGRLTFVATLSREDDLFGSAGGSATENRASFANDASAVPLVADSQTGEGGGDGRILVFKSEASLTDDDTDGGYRDVFRFDSAAGPPTMECVSCRPGGDDSEPFDVHSIAEPGYFQQFNLAPKAQFAEEGRWVSEDGRSIVFATAEPLVSSDLDGKENPYLWRDEGGHGRLSLFPAVGTGEITVSHTGDEVAFITSSVLTGADGDSAADVYVARADGGFVEPTAPAHCQGEACQGSPAPSPPSAVVGTGAFAGNGNVRPKKQSRHHKKKHHHRSSHHKKKPRHQTRRHDKRKNHKMHGADRRPDRKHGREPNK